MRKTKIPICEDDEADDDEHEGGRVVVVGDAGDSCGSSSGCGFFFLVVRERSQEAAEEDHQHRSTRHRGSDAAGTGLLALREAVHRDFKRALDPSGRSSCCTRLLRLDGR